ncbi:MAG: NifB/NifX family molybdenum-iron cluster-binding protein [Bacilli bacterium]
MKIAIASNNGKATAHFGHCEGFACFEITDKTVNKQEWLPNPGHQPGFLPKFLKEKGVNFIITGGMGKSAIDLFTEFGITAITGASGSVDSILNAFLNDQLVKTVTPCEEHQHGC